MNPFLIKGYKNPDYFCDREYEKSHIIQSIENGQDVTLYAIRRIGKSALIHHVFNSLQSDYDCIFADIWGTTSLNDFSAELANATIKSNVFVKSGFGNKLRNFVRSIGASLSVGMDGRPSVKIQYNDISQVFKNLEEILSFLNSHKKPVVLAIDEFQEINKYRDHIPLEAKLRALGQQCQNIRFIYSGSEHHLLNEVFSTYDRPFYQSTRMMEIGTIPENDYKDFILQKFTQGRKDILPEIIDHILHMTYSHTYYVQAICNHLYANKFKVRNLADFDKLYYDYLTEKRVFYEELPERLTRQQFNTVKAFAVSGKVDSPTSAEFLQKAAIRSPSSMQGIIKALLDKQIIISENDYYRIYDVFLEHFLRNVK